VSALWENWGAHWGNSLAQRGERNGQEPHPFGGGGAVMLCGSAPATMDLDLQLFVL
jgi:hypothetical protein